MFYRLVLFLVAYALTTSIAFAQSGGVVVTPVSVTPYTSTAQNVIATATFEGRLAYQSSSVAQGLYYQRAVTFSAQQMAAASRSRMAGAVAGAAALSAVILGIGYSIDAITGDIYTDAGSEGLPPNDGTYWCISGAYCSSTVSAAVAAYASYLTTNEPNYYGGHRSGTQNTDANFNIVSYKYAIMNKYCMCWVENAFTVTRYGSAQQGIQNYTQGAELAQPATHATDQQVHDAVRSSPDAVREALHHPDGRPRVVQPMPAIMDEVAAQYRQDIGTPLAEGETDEPAVVDTPETEPTATGFPAFCQWASKLCDFVDWVRAPPDADADLDLPETQIQPVTWVSGLGTGTCPSPRAINLSLGSYEMSWQPVCDLALGIKAFLFISASLTAAFIISGAVRNA